MRVDFKIALILALAALPAGAALMVAPDYLHLSGIAVPLTFWGGIVLSVVLILIAAIIALRAEREAPTGRWGVKAMWPQYLMTICGIGFFIGLVGFLQINVPPSPTIKDVPRQEFSWNWEPLTVTESDKLFRALKDTAAQTIEILCNPQTGGVLADSFEAVFKKLNWPIQHSARRGQIWTPPVTGLAFEAANETTLAVKSAIERFTDLTVNIGPVSDYPIPGHPRLFIGAKPLPNDAPESVKARIAAIALRSQALSKEIAQFASDRQREEALLPPRDSYPGAIGLQQHWERGRQFRQQTEALSNQRFGSSAAARLGELDQIGIEPAFGIGMDNPSVFSNWLGAVSDLLLEGKVAEARTTAANTRFWMSQH
jgi:hypothetical protein